jgi:hypothetical protein
MTLTVLAFVLAFPTAAPAVYNKLGMAGAQFLKIGVGRSTGMGEAFVAIADDASATYWNPAGLALVPQYELLLNHVDWASDISHEYVSFVAPTRIGSFGFAVTALSMGQMEETTIEDPQGTGRKFAASDLAFGVTYARRFTDKFTFGATAKVLNQQIWDMAAAGLAFDFGVHYNTGLNNLRLAMAITNFGPDLRYSGNQLRFDYDPPWEWPWTRTPMTGELLTETYPLPVTFRFGAAYDVVKRERTRLTAAADLVHYNDVSEKINLGLEYELYGFRLRGGYALNVDPSYTRELGSGAGLTAGAGLTLKAFKRARFGLDYGYRELGWLGATHRLNLLVDF